MKDYEPSPRLLSGRAILVTGAGDGIGRAAARAFAAHGATVVLLGRTISKLEAVYDEIDGAGHPQPAIYPMNLEGAAPQDYENLTETFKNEFGRLDGLLHNAAELGTLTPLEHYDPATWARVIQINLNASFLLTRACLPLLLQSDDASILFTSASVGRQGQAYWGAYGVSKFAVEGMMQILAEELENSRIRVNSIDPESVRTAMYTRAYPGRDPRTLLGPDDIMPTYLYLLGPDSRGTTGQALSAQSDD